MPPPPPHRRAAARAFVRTRAGRLLLPVVAVAVLGLVLGAAVAATIHVPAVASIADYAHDINTVLFDRGGRPYQEYFLESRFLLAEGEVPKLLQDALLVSEDRDFFTHAGIDVPGIARAALGNFRQGRRSQGASTLSMQAAGLLFLDRQQRTWKRKITEAFYAVELEKTLSKQQILTLYCNLIPLGHHNYGFESAARYYFGRHTSELSPAQAASLVAIVPRPSEWTPIKKPELVTRRRDRILGLMLEAGALDAEQYALAIAEPMKTVARKREARVGPYFAEEVRRYLYRQYGERGLYQRGLQVHTTLDTAIQSAAEDALRRGLFELDRNRGWRGPVERLGAEAAESTTLPSWSGLALEPGVWSQGVVATVSPQRAEVRIDDRRFELLATDAAWTRKSLPAILRAGDVAWFEIGAAATAGEPKSVGEPKSAGEPRTAGEPLARVSLVQESEIEGAVVVLESATGAVRAMVGGWSFERNEFNRATQARRQIGSAFKPFLIGAAYESGFTPADTVFDAPAVFAGADNLPTYSPRNFSRLYYGITTLRRVVEKSINVSSVKLQDLIGADRVIDFARRCGIASPLHPYSSLALGVAELSPLETAAGYASIANQGIHVEPYLIESVTTPDGRALETHQLSAAKAMEPTIAYLLTHTMRGVVERGTGSELKSLGLPIAGKTGTTDSYADAWFAGFTPRYSIVVWVGYDKVRSLGKGMTGAQAALPTWKLLAERGLAEGWIDAAEDFQAPPGIVFRQIEPWTGLLANGRESESITEAFLSGTEPVQEYQPRWQTIMSLPWYQQRAFYGKPKDGENMPEDIVDWSLVENVKDSE